MKVYRIILTITVVIVSIIVSCLVYLSLRQQQAIQELHTKIDNAVSVDVTPTSTEKKEHEIEPEGNIVTKGEVWRPVQEKIKDTVVQVFAQITKVDLLMPFKTPSQHSAFGSAFFINDAGELITNAHVVNQAKAIWIQIPSLGKEIIDVELVGMSPERDLALLRVKPEGLALIKERLGKVPYLALGDSDTVRRADEVMALGYPLGQQSLKSTTGIISGREHNMFQLSAAINPGNSGGPLVNMRGEVIGINSEAILEAQNVGYMIPINDLKNILPDLYKDLIVRKPLLGLLFNNATESLTEFLGNPKPGGCYVIEVIKNSPLEKAGVKRGDMIYAINGHAIDSFGEVAWSEDKISIIDYVARLSVGENVKLTVYRNGKRKDVVAKFNQAESPAIKKIYPGYEKIDYEVVGGMVVMPLTINHIHLMAQTCTGLAKYAEMSNQAEPALVVTHIFPNSQLFRSRAIMPGSILKEVNNKKVGTLEEMRAALKSGVNGKFLTIRAADTIARASEHVFVALPLEKVLQEEPQLALDYRYALSDTVKDMLKAVAPNIQKSVGLTTQLT